MRDKAVALLFVGLFSLLFGFPLTLMMGRGLFHYFGTDVLATFVGGVSLGMCLGLYLEEAS